MIVFFDGHCSLCNGFVDFLIRRDRQRRLKYAPLQGQTARTRLPAAYVTDLSTMVLDADGVISTESTAALRTIAALGGVYSVVSVFTWVPRFIRDGVYRLVARHRYRWWSRRDTCRLPTAEEKAYFLD